MSVIRPFAYIGPAQIPVWKRDDGAYIWLSGYDIDGDGSGGNLENDSDFQNATTYRNPDGTSLNSREENFIVIPENLAKLIPAIVMGSKASVTSLITGESFAFVAADLGPTDRIGEGSIAGANCLNVPPSPTTGGNQQPVFYYELYAGVAAEVAGKKYSLQSLT